MSKNVALLQKAGKDQDLFQTSDSPSALVRTIDYEAAPKLEAKHREAKHQEAEPRSDSLQIRRSGVIKGVIEEKIRSLGQEIPKRARHQSDLETLRYREEVKLVQRIFPLNAQKSPQLVMFSSVESEAHACSICARTGEILAGRAEGPVCVVDADLRSPFLHRYFRVENRRGLSDALRESGPAQDFAQHLSNNLWVMPSGSAAVQLNVPQVSERVGPRMMELRTLFKYVVINSPLYLDRAPTAPSFAADGIVLIVEANATRRETVRDVMEELQMVGTRVLGVVLNNRTFPIPDSIYHKF